MISMEQITTYVDRGWSVLPIAQGKKSPAMQSWTDYTKTAATIEQLDTWFKALTGAGIGVVTGRLSGIVVIDMEADCPTSLDDVLAAFPTGLVSHTGGGGYHLFYKYPPNVEKVGNRVKIYDGVDIRGDNGFIVLPPTRHPSGGEYKWVSVGEPGAFPMALIDQLDKPEKKASDMWVTSLLDGVGEGERNNSCARLAGYFASKLMPIDVTKALLGEWNEKNTPPMSNVELERTIESVYRGFSGNIALQPEPVKSDTGVTNQFDLASFSAYAQRYATTEDKWLVRNWLVDKSVTFIVSPPESYKTWLLLDLAVSVAMGKPFLGKFETTAQGGVFIIQQEDAPAALVERISLIVQKKLGLVPYDEEEGALHGFCMPDLPIYFHTSRKLKFGDLDILRDIEEHIKTIRPKLILIDPLYSATSSADSYMADLAGQMMILKDWRDKYGCSFVIAHHSRKSASADDMQREDAWGSQFINAFLEAGWQIRRDPKKLLDNQIFLRRHSKVTGNAPTVTLTFHISTEFPYRYDVSVKALDARVDDPVPRFEIIELIAREPMTQSEIARASGISKATISRHIRELVHAGRAVQLPNGKFMKKIIEEG